MSYSILPADRYKVINKTILSEVDRQNLMNFYEDCAFKQILQIIADFDAVKYGGG